MNADTAPSAPLQLWSDDSRFGVRIPHAQVAQLLQHCAAAGTHETGGILIGHYTPARDCAEVTEVTGPPKDSAAGRTWFVRGVHRLSRHLQQLWNEQRSFYLGEWHFHPGATPTPSSTDDQQMLLVAASPAYHCPEPLLIIVGETDPQQIEICAWVYRRNGPRLLLHH